MNWEEDGEENENFVAQLNKHTKYTGKEIITVEDLITVFGSGHENGKIGVLIDGTFHLLTMRPSDLPTSKSYITFHTEHDTPQPKIETGWNYPKDIVFYGKSPK